MTTGWIKLTSPQLAQLATLTAANTTNDFITPVADVAGDSWIAADCLAEIAGLFAPYAPLLATLVVTQADEPTWPAAV